jgi:predicted ATPase
MPRVTDISSRARPKPSSVDPVRGASRLPAERTSFVGREGELRRIGELFAEGARLVTIVGPAGNGKTRLATRLGHASSSRWDLVVLADLSEASSPRGIALALANGLGVTSSDATTDPAEDLAGALVAAGGALVILDNFEHVVEHAAATLGRWIDDAPNACFLVTSREPLGLRGEARLELPPLAPEEAVALFADRAAAVRTDFELTPANEATVVAVVERLDRIPLAVELAAARAGVLSPAELLDRLSSASWLRSVRRDGPERHATLQAAIDWSWRLLDEAEQATLARLSIFRGGFDLEAAEATELGDAGPAVLDLVESLRAKSLIRAYGPPGPLSDTTRFVLYATVRDFARERLRARGGEASARTAHARHFAAVAERCADALEGPDRSRCVGRAELDLDNMLCAHA